MSELVVNYGGSFLDYDDDDDDDDDEPIVNERGVHQLDLEPELEPEYEREFVLNDEGNYQGIPPVINWEGEYAERMDCVQAERHSSTPKQCGCLSNNASELGDDLAGYVPPTINWAAEYQERIAAAKAEARSA